MKVSTLSKIVIVSALALVTVFATHSTANAARKWVPGDKVYVPGLGCFLILDVPTVSQSRVSPQLIIPPWVQRIGDTCDTGPSSVRGYAFLDKNANGKWDEGESIFGEAWYKVTDGGAWFTCGYVGTDASYGVPVNAGTYYVLPVAPKGFKTTTPRIQVTVGTTAALNNNIGFVADATAKGEACDQYNPAR